MNNTVATLESKLPTTTPRVRQMAGLYALKPWFTGRLTPIVNVAVTGASHPTRSPPQASWQPARPQWPSPSAAGRWPRCSWCCGWPAPTSTARWPAPRQEPAVGLRRQRDRRPHLGSAGLRRPGGVRRAPRRPGTALAVLAGASGPAGRTRRDDCPRSPRWPQPPPGATPQRRPIGKTERCLFMVLATAFPVIMPVLLMQLVNGSLITTVLRLRAARRELAAKQRVTDECSAD